MSDRGDDKVNKRDREYFARTLAAAILDLDSGYMAVGGLTAVGRGLFKADKIRIAGNTILDRYGDMEKNINAESVYQRLVKDVSGKV